MKITLETRPEILRMVNIIVNIIFQYDFKVLVKLKIDVDIWEHSYYIIILYYGGKLQ